jgi:hypothetical protein
MKQTSVIAMGLPNAGKSTFIAALGYVMQHEEVKTSLRLARLPDDVSYINSLTDDWLKCADFERTKAGLELVSFELEDSSGPVGEVIFPDISGESFEHHWALREWEPEFANLAKVAGGALLFVHPLHLAKPYSIADVAKVAATVGENADERKAEIWEPEKAAPQVKLVDFLQMLASQTTKPWPLRIGVVVSAWDLVTKVSEKAQPDSWLKKAAPLLYHFLLANPEMFTTRYFGVSAQGGDNKKDGDTLRSFDDPSQRIVVIGECCAEHDLSAPLEWVLNAHA